MFFLFDIMFLLLSLILLGVAFFVFDELILKGYFATKLRKRFNVESLK